MGQAGEQDESAPGPVFVGRRPELAAAVPALSDPPALVLVEGEAGVGKTRLVQECLRRLTPPPVVVTAACPPLQEPFPLGPLVAALASRWRTAGAVPLSPLAGALRPLFPEWSAQLPPPPEPVPDRRAARHQLFRALAELLAQLGTELLVVEDAHWADSSTVDFLTALVTTGQPPVSLVLTYRPTDLAPDASLRRLTAYRPADRRRARIALEPFQLAETRDLIAAEWAAADLPDDVVAFLHERTQGLPLALAETLLLLRDRGEMLQRGDRWRRRELDALQVPPTIRDSVLERVGRLDAPARRLLEAAAVLAEPADEQQLAAVAELPAGPARAGLAGALTRGLLREARPGQFEVSHGLAARAVVEALPSSERRRLHGRAGEVLRQRENPPMARLRRHFREPGDHPAWRHSAEAAADLALASGDDLAAVEALHELLAAAPPAAAPERARLAGKLGEAAVDGVAALGELGSEVAGTLWAALSGELPAGDRGRLRVLLGRLLLQLGRFDEAYAQLQEAVTELPDQPEQAARAMMSLAFPRGNRWPAGRHLAWLHRATGLLPRVPAPADRTSLLVDRATALLLLGEAEGWQAVAELSAAQPDAEPPPTLPQRRQHARLLMNAGHLAVVWGHHGYAAECLRAAERLMSATGYERLMNSVQLTRAYLDWHAGAWDGLADRVSQLTGVEDTLPEARLEARLVQGLLALAAGRRDTAEQELREVAEHAARRGLADTQMLPAAALGRLLLADGAPEAAVALTLPGVDLIAGKGVWVWAADIVPVHVAALAAAGRPATAEALVDRFTTELAGRAAPAAAAAAQVCRAVLSQAAGRPLEAAARARVAAQAWAGLPRPYDELLALELRGGCLLAAGGHRQEGLRLLAEVQQRLWALGARWDADRLAHQLRGHGVEVRRTWRGGRRGYGDRLSPRELEVVRLVARGLTNRQVAETLFLSPRTVERHLHKAMHKLSVSSRTTLVMAAADAGLLGDGGAPHAAQPKDG